MDIARAYAPWLLLLLPLATAGAWATISVALTLGDLIIRSLRGDL
jgi:hypothetical protein